MNKIKHPELVTNRKYELKRQSVAANKKISRYVSLMYILCIILITYLLRIKTDINWIVTILISILSPSMLSLTFFLFIEFAMVVRKIFIQKRLIPLFELYQNNILEENLEKLESIKMREKLFIKMRRMGADNFNHLKIYKSDLKNIDLSYCNFNSCVFEKCNLSNSNFSHSVFEYCSIVESNLDFCNFYYSIFMFQFNFKKSIFSLTTDLKNCLFFRRLDNQEKFDLFEKLENQDISGLEIIKSKFISNNLGTRNIGDIVSYYVDVYRIEMKSTNEEVSR